MPPRQPGLNGLPIHVRDGRFICYVRTNTGERKQRALHIRADGTTASERAAVAAYWQEQARATAGQDVRARTPAKTLQKALEALTKAQVVANLGPDAHSKTYHMGRNLVRHYGPDFDLTTLTTQAQLVEYAAEALKTRSGSSTKQEIGVLGQAMGAVGLVRPKMPKLDTTPKPQQPLTEDEQRRVLLACTPEHKLTILLFLTLGPRRSEIGKVGAIDWTARTMWIHGTKTKRSNREVPIPEELWEEMEAQRRAGTWKGFAKLSNSRVYKIVRAACKRAGLDGRHPNDLRGTASQRMRAAGVDAEVRAAIQGNSAAMQEQTYTQTHKMIDVMREAVDSTKRIKSPSANASKEASATDREALDNVKSLKKSQ